MLWELFAPNIQRIERICTIRSVLQKVLFRFRILLCRLVFSEAIATALNSSRQNGENKIIIVLAQGYALCLSPEAHRATENISTIDLPTSRDAEPRLPQPLSTCPSQSM